VSALVVVELSFDGTDLFNDDGTRMFGITKGHPGSPPVVRGRDTTVPHRTGRIRRSRVASSLGIVLEGWETAPSGLALDDARAAFRQAVRGLFALFDGTTDPRVLQALLEDGSIATIDASPLPPLLYKETVPGLAAEFNIELESVDPYWLIVDGS